ncbi:F-box/LRR-repeat protein fbxl-1-like isoform X2 [Gigantopelta aegis]|uniref:F-box/LRR-repeat protein fbxl-1-like isoform X2 n=1 Tax=Gigantopelta aegis TaxID=1735272 RepID=UPI001B88820B|nr:F-box/LRR-repeat protein fbxl-1-like isoform X2 [Gigantopelta aegis]
MVLEVVKEQRKDGTATSGQQFSAVTIDKIPDKLLLKVFSFLKHSELGRVAQVCRKWRLLAYDSRLWKCVSLRADYSGLHISHLDTLLGLISLRFGATLQYIELPSEIITAPVLHELANKCPALRCMTLDFSNAMQLHDFNDLNAFPCNLRSLCICLSEVIFLEGFMRRIYSCLSSIEVLHLIGTFELSSESEEDNYEVINIGKIKAHTPNLKVVNLYGICFLDDSHIELLCSNCIHIECLALNFCLGVRGSSFQTLIQRCKKLKTLLLQHTGLEEKHMQSVAWETSSVQELDLTSTELSEQCLENVLTRMPGFTYLGLGYCEFFSDKVLEKLVEKGKLNRLSSLDISYTHALSENATLQFLHTHGHNLQGLMLVGKPKLTENFWLMVIHHMKNLRICGLGTANGWFLRMQSRVHLDQVIETFAQNCCKLERLEIQWDPDSIRFSDKSSKFIDHLRLKCPRLKSFTLSDGEYYEMVKSNFERADRTKVVRTTTNYQTSLVSLLHCYSDLLFN